MRESVGGQIRAMGPGAGRPVRPTSRRTASRHRRLSPTSFHAPRRRLQRSATRALPTHRDRSSPARAGSADRPVGSSQPTYSEVAGTPPQREVIGKQCPARFVPMMRIAHAVCRASIASTAAGFRVGHSSVGVPVRLATMTTERQAERALAELREICLGFPEVSQRLSHGAPSFFVRGKRRWRCRRRPPW